jgi:hypothetical protein
MKISYFQSEYYTYLSQSYSIRRPSTPCNHYLQEKAIQFPLDCQQLATAQCIYAHQLQRLGIVDRILWEADEETYLHFPRLQLQLRSFFSSALARLLLLDPAQLVRQRYDKYRQMGQFALLDPAMRAQELARIRAHSAPKPPRKVMAPTSSQTACALLQHVAEEVVTGKLSLHRNRAPPNVQTLAEKLLAGPIAPPPPATASVSIFVPLEIILLLLVLLFH